MSMCSMAHALLVACHDGMAPLAKPRYDQNTYIGRVRHFYDVTDMRTLLASRTSLEEAARVVDDYIAGRPVNYTDEQLWSMKKRTLARELAPVHSNCMRRTCLCGSDVHSPLHLRR